MTGNTRRRALRWSLPAAVAAAIAVVASGVLTAGANPPLPARTAAQLLVDVQNVRISGLSGTIVQKADLGLPELPAVSQKAAGSPLTSLLAGSHTLRVWMAGPDRQRLALLGALGESDIIHNGRDVWLWDSDTKSATHYRLANPTGHPATPERGDPLPAGLTPQEAADAALRAIDPTTAVSTDGTASVAGRAAYELVLRPRDGRSLIGQVRLALDAVTHLPLRVQVYPRASGDGPAYEVGFTRISYAPPGDEQFQFSPPPGTVVTQADPDAGAAGMPPAAGTGRPRIVGSGWSAVAVLPALPSLGLDPAADRPGGAGTGPRRGPGAGNTPGAASAPGASNDLSTDASGPLGSLLDRLPRVSGRWGSGRLLTGKLFSALFTDDGRLLVGAVAPDLLYQAAGQR